MKPSPKPISWTFSSGSASSVKPLDLDSLPKPTAEEMEAMRKTDPGSLPWDVYFDFLKQFTPTKEQLEALPLSSDVPPFRLD